jgi:hypothetical protein
MRDPDSSKVKRVAEAMLKLDISVGGRGGGPRFLLKMR